MIVYLVTNNVNGKQYVGQTIKTLNTRWQQHQLETSHVSCLRNAIKKYGTEAFSVEVLHVCETREEMSFVEMFYISLLNTKSPCGYNLTDGGEGNLGHIASEETRAKLSKAKLGKKPANPIKKGQRISPDTEIKQGQRLSPSTEFKKGSDPWNKGKPYDCGQRGRKHKPESIEKMRQAQLGKKQSPETIAKPIKGREWRHGTSTGYKNHKCRCDLCKKWKHDDYIRRFGIKTPEEIRENLRVSHLGQKAWNAGTGKGIYQRNSGSWRAIVMGKRYGTFKTKEEAEQRLAEVRRVNDR